MLVGGRKIERGEFNQELAALDRGDRSFDKSGSALLSRNNQTSEVFQLKLLTKVLKKKSQERDGEDSDPTRLEF